MQVNHLPREIQSVLFENMIWTMVIDEVSNQLIIELRNERDKKVFLVCLKPDSKKVSKLDIEPSWWDKLVTASPDEICLISYNDQNNPSDHQFYRIDRSTGERAKLDSIPEVYVSAVLPQLYEHGTAHHKTVSEFMGLELPFACEYIELNDYIIISYYLRSENGFDRFLLCLKGGEKKWKLKQDAGVKGFSPGAFFVLKNQLIFIRERNEVCFYNL